MPHLGQRHVGRIAVLASDEVAAIDFREGVTGDRPTGCRDQRIFRGQRLREQTPLDERCIFDSTLLFRISNLAIDRDQVLRIGFPFAGGERDQRVARGGRHLPQLKIHGWSGAAPKCAHVERRELGVAHDEFNIPGRHVEFFGYSLGERGANVLADLDFAGIDGDSAVFADVQPGFDFLGKRIAAASSGSPAGFLRHRCIFRHREDHDASSEEAEELAAIEIEMIRSGSGEFVAFGLQGTRRGSLPVNKNFRVHWLFPTC